MGLCRKLEVTFVQGRKGKVGGSWAEKKRKDTPSCHRDAACLKHTKACGVGEWWEGGMGFSPSSSQSVPYSYTSKDQGTDSNSTSQAPLLWL